MNENSSIFLSDEASELTSVLEQLKLTMALQFEAAVDMVSGALKSGNKMLLAGNGGSAAEAQHMAAEYVATLDSNNKRKGLPALSLSTDTSFLTAWSNDFGYDSVFSRQVEVFGHKGDVLLAYSTSGNSRNILRAVETARTLGIKTIGFTGHQGGKMAALCDICLIVPSGKTQRIQEVHTFLGHALCGLVERRVSTFNGL